VTSGGTRGRERALRAFEERFGARAPVIARAPGRVNLIGEHTDYNDGFALPMAIDRAVWIAFEPTDDPRVVLHSVDFDSSADIDLATLSGSRPPVSANADWREYVHGVAWALDDAGLRLARGLRGVVSGDVPRGAGLSSSAALELAVARALVHASALAWDAEAMALVCQRAENDWMGVQCGIMDQLVCAKGQRGHALLIDCRSLVTRAVPVPASAAIVILDSATRRDLAQSAYNERRAQCEVATAFFGVPALRDLDQATFDRRGVELDTLTRRRARHVVTENARTIAATAALENGDLAEVGVLMQDSHASLRDDFEVSRRELDQMVAIANAQPGCHGARMTGAGFGGCAVALIDADVASDFTRAVCGEYRRHTGLEAAAYVCSPSDGASIE
jgi:galactokinase